MKTYEPVCQEQIEDVLVAINENNDVIVVGPKIDGSGIETILLGNSPVKILAIALYLQHLVAMHMGVNIEDLMQEALQSDEEEIPNVNVHPENRNRH